MRTFLRRVGLRLGLLRVPESTTKPGAAKAGAAKAGAAKTGAAKTGAAKAELRKSTRTETAIALGLSGVLLVLIAAMVLSTESGFWRAVGFIAFCVLAIGLGQRLRNLTRRR